MSELLYFNHSSEIFSIGYREVESGDLYDPESIAVSGILLAASYTMTYSDIVVIEDLIQPDGVSTVDIYRLLSQFCDENYNKLICITYDILKVMDTPPIEFGIKLYQNNGFEYIPLKMKNLTLQDIFIYRNDLSKPIIEYLTKKE